MLEKDIVAMIRRYLKLLGADIFFFKEHGGQYSTAGIPDLICCYKGRFVAFEVKSPVGKPTELQKRTLEKIQKAGGVAFVVRSVKEVQDIISMIDKQEV